MVVPGGIGHSPTCMIGKQVLTLANTTGRTLSLRRTLPCHSLRHRSVLVNSGILESKNNDNDNDNGKQNDSNAMEYSRGWAWQQVILNRRLEHLRRTTTSSITDSSDEDGNRDRLLMMEHTPVYTLGRGAKEENLTFLQSTNDGGSRCVAVEAARVRLSRAARGPGSARLGGERLTRRQWRDEKEEVDSLLEQQACSPVLAPNGTPIYRIERGGEVTYHGPGQLVVYPMLDLRETPYRKDLHWYLRTVEEVIIRVLKEYDIQAVRDDINTGVWVGNEKIAAVGVSSSRWITTHGFALNVDPDLSYFDTSIIVPCGIEGRNVTSIAKVLRNRKRDGNSKALSSSSLEVKIPTLEQISNVVLRSFEDTFGVSTVEGAKLT